MKDWGPRSDVPDLTPITPPSLASVADRDGRVAEAIRAEAHRLRRPLADLLAELALEGWRARCAAEAAP
jgi:hypothetical protein